MFFRRDSQRPPSRHTSLMRHVTSSSSTAFVRRAGWRTNRWKRAKCWPTFEAMGPAAVDPQFSTEKVSPDNEVSGAIHTVIAHPTNAGHPLRRVGQRWHLADEQCHGRAAALGPADR